jgi:ComF family protein
MRLLNPAKIFTKILDVIYPQDCPVCGREAEISSLCENCAKAYINGYRSFVSDIEYGGRTLKIFAIDIFNAETAKIIHNLKYNSIKKNAADIFRFGLTTFYDTLSKADLITFVPLHPLRFLRRGYNQAEVLAKTASAQLNIACRRTMRRRRYNITQTKKNAEKRKAAVVNLFEILKKADVCGKTVILIDDVCTTGSTVGECGKVLYEAGAKEVIVLVLAKV